jgi:UDP-sulfoquinovose synthase
MKIIIFGGDGFCGWPTALHLAANRHDVLIVDNLSRRVIDEDLKSGSLTKIHSLGERVSEAKKIIGNIDFRILDIAKDISKLRSLIAEFSPNTIIHFAEQRSAPYSMLHDDARRYTVNNNITATHNILSTIVDIDRDIHFVHLGTMGVYGYNKDFGKIPEGYLPVNIRSTGYPVSIVYPPNPGSIYHLTKCLDQTMFQYYHKNWNLRITDLHQGIVWGTQTNETKKSEILVNRFDYDGIYGTVLNRFISQAASGHPLTVYGSGGQTRAFIHISDTARCIKLAVESDNFKNSSVRIFNQISEVKSVMDLANIIQDLTGAKIEKFPNPRKEAAENSLEVENSGLKSLGFEPILLSDKLVEDVYNVSKSLSARFLSHNVLNSPKW